MPKKQSFEAKDIQRVRELCHSAMPSLEALRLTMRVSYPTLAALLLKARVEPVRTPTGIVFAATNAGGVAASESILSILASDGPMTRYKLQSKLDYTRNGMQKALKRLHDSGAVHIADWVCTAATAQLLPVYKIGAGTDAEKKVSNTKSAIDARKYRRKSAEKKVETKTYDSVMMLPSGFFGV